MSHFVKTKNKYSLVALLIAVITIGYLVFQAIPLNVFAYDILGYYLYLPAGFKYKDIALNNYDQIQNILSTYGTSEGFSQAFKVENGNWVMKYPMGMAVMYYPFYVIGDNLAHLFKYPTDGFSLPYQLSVLYGCFLYTIIGLITFRKVLLYFFSDVVSAITLILVVFGTNYLLHVSIHAQPAMVHNLVFSLHTLTIYFTIKWHKDYKIKHIVALGFVIGLTAITRPTEFLIVLFPLFYNIFNIQSLKQKIRLIKLYKKQIFLCVGIIFTVVSYQLLYWKIITGKFVFDSYSDHLNEGFNFLHPYILEFLFSFRKGWFVFTPIMIFAIIGFYFLYKNNKYLFLSIIAYFILNLYVMSSWSCWWYGTSFSSRAAIPSYVLLSICLGYFVSFILEKKMKFIFIFIFILFISFNIFQSWQAAHGILDGSRMTKAYYKSVFFQTSGPTEEQKKLLLRDKYSSQALLDPNSINFYDYKLVYRQEENFDTFKKSDPNISDSIFVSENYAFMTDKNFAFAGDIRKKYNEITNKSYLILKLSAKIFTRFNPKDLEARLAITMMHKGKGYEFKCIDIRQLDLKSNEWNKIEFYMWTPDFWDRRDIIQSYFWNMSDKPIFVDDLKIEAYEPMVDETVF